MGTTILNGTPKVNFLGTEDLSGSIVTPEPIPVPQHLPKFYFWAEKGDLKPRLCNSNELIRAYGIDTFDPQKKYFNNAQLFTNNIIAEGNSIVAQRIVPTDASTSNMVIGIEYREMPSADMYLREADGSYSLDANGDKILNGTADVVEVRFVKFSVSGTDLTDKMNFTGSSDIGDYGDIGWTFVPMIHFEAVAPGSYYNNVGVTLAPVNNDSFNQTLANVEKVLTYNLKLVKRENAYTSPATVSTLYGEDSLDLVFKEGIIDPTTDSNIDIGSNINTEWFNTEDELLPLNFDIFKNVVVYYSEIDTFLKLLMAKEKLFVDQNNYEWFDYNGYGQSILDEEYGLINFLTMKSTKGVPYFTIRPYTNVFIDDGIEVYGTSTASAYFSGVLSTLIVDGGSMDASLGSYVSFTSGSPIYLNGGGDGLLNETNFNTVIKTELDKYLDPASDVMDIIKNPETVMYDVGYKLDVKNSLMNFISLRKNTFLFLTTCQGGIDNNSFVSKDTQSDMLSIASSLNNSLKLMPESTYFGTKVMRSLISEGDMIMDSYSKSGRVPLLLDKAIKFAAYAGASNYKWKSKNRFDRAPGSVITTGRAINPEFIPETTKPILWKNNIVYPQPYTTKQFFYPAMQSVYDNDTSVLNSALVGLAICTLNTVAYKAWLSYTGSIHLTNAQLEDAVVGYVNEAVVGIFDGMFNIVPTVDFTKRDLQRGYSWTLVIKIYANNQKTVMTTKIEAHRM